MVDLHCHILPGIDDGPADFGGSIALGRALVEDGVQIVAATPHLRDDHRRVDPHELTARCAELNQELAAQEVPLRVLVGGEVDLLWAETASDEALRLVSLGQRGTDLLVETPYGPLPPSFERLMGPVVARGYRVLLAHPERNPSFQSDPERLAALVEQGFLCQVTATSLASRDRRSRSRRLAAELVSRGLAHVIATDSHRATGGRAPLLAAGVAAARELAPTRAAWMAVEAPLAILAGRPLAAPAL